jgi:UPF0755 protein
LLFLFGFVCLAGVGGWLYSLKGQPPSFVADWANAPVATSAPIEFDLIRGTSLKNFSDQMFSAGLTNNAQYFYWWVRLYRDFGSFQAGHYQVSGAISPLALVDKIKKGETYTPIALQFTIPEGFTLRQITERLLSKGVGTQEEFESLTRDAKFLAELKVPGATLEGYLYPLTYSFKELPNARQAISAMAKAFWQNLPQDYEARLRERGLTLDKAVCIASLIELETRFDDERAKVAEVILARLKGGGPLGIDATIIYGIPNFAGDLTFKHLKDPTNPYNSRIHRGLPPTAIGSPSKASLEAVVSPTAEGYFYYVVDPENGGKHHFSKDAKEHGQYVKKLLQHERNKKHAG